MSFTDQCLIIRNLYYIASRISYVFVLSFSDGSTTYVTDGCGILIFREWNLKTHFENEQVTLGLSCALVFELHTTAI